MTHLRKEIGFHETSECDQFDSRISNLNSSYEIMTEEGKEADMTLLVMHFGILCQSALDRLNHNADGFIIAIQHMGQKFRVFRKVQSEKQNTYPQLRLLKL